MATITGSFKNIKEETISVIINNRNSSDSYIIEDTNHASIYFADDPITIETNCDDMFTTIIKKTCTISLISKIYLGDILFAANERSITVQIYKDNNIIFDGYVKPNTYSQGWANEYEEFEINCIDHLGCLEYEYLTDQTSWSTLYGNSSMYSFSNLLKEIFYFGQEYNNLHWDNSKTVTNGTNNIFDDCAVTINVFLGDNEDDIMTNEEILNEILKYTNMHIIQEGSNFFIFDWDTINNCSITSWVNIYNGSRFYAPIQAVNIQKDDYASDDTNLTMSDIYNQISLKCEFEVKDELISNLLEDDSIDFYANVKQKFLRRYGDAGSGFDARTSFITYVLQGSGGAWPAGDSRGPGFIQEWYFKWGYNPMWTLTYEGVNIEDIYLNTNDDNYINQWLILKGLKENNFMPAILNIGTPDSNGKINSSNYLVISVNGTGEDSDAAATRIDIDNENAAGYNGCILEYNSGESGIYSPGSEDVTNYLIFSGKMILAPRIPLTGGVDYPFSSLVDDINNSRYNKITPVVNIPWDGWAYYTHQFYAVSDPNINEPYPINDTNLICPPLGTHNYELQYNYSSVGDSVDRIDLIPVLRCQMTIGNKYLCMKSNGDKKQPIYAWKTQSEATEGDWTTSFSLGFNPSIGEFIIGKEWSLSNTVQDSNVDAIGTAIPITYEDALQGTVNFKILGVENPMFKEIYRTHPTLFRHTSWDEYTKVVMSHVSNIWIRDFSISIKSNNGGKELSNKSQDILYMSNEQTTYIKKKDDITFKINTLPSNAELISMGISSNVSNTNVLNTNNSHPLETITCSNISETDRPEKLYIDQYYRYYNSPKVILESTLHNNWSYPFFKKYSFNGFSNLIPINITTNLKLDNITLECRQS